MQLTAALMILLAATNAPVERVPPGQPFAAAAAKLHADNASFDQIFAAACRQCLELGGDADTVRAMFGGLWTWAKSTGKPTLQGRNDWALHFLAGGALEGYLGLGSRAAVAKERRDARDAGNRYDLDDLTATLLGTRWMEIATIGTAQETRQWLELWATGKMSLAGALPTLERGQLAGGEEADDGEIVVIRQLVNEALQPRPLTNAPAVPLHRSGAP